MKKNWRHCPRLRGKEHLFRYRALLEGIRNLLRFVRARAHARANDSEIVRSRDV